VDVLKCAASLPLDPLELSLSVREVAQGVQTAAERHTAACRRAVRVLVIGVQGSMKVLVKISQNPRNPNPNDSRSLLACAPSRCCTV
jgi:hypothetical protein